MEGRIGDSIVVESERVAQPSRRGKIEEVLHDAPPRYRVAWDDGHTSIFSPSAGSAWIERDEQSAAGSP
jgi:hypothetical protein